MPIFSNPPPFEEDNYSHHTVQWLENYHRRHYGIISWLLLAALLAGGYWAKHYRIDEVARATGEVIASSRVQVIQSVDGGVLQSLNVREGDRVKQGQILAQLDRTRVGAAVREIEARLSALKAKAVRLRAEVTGASKLTFPDELKVYSELIEVESALFQQRKTGLAEELRTLKVAMRLAEQEANLTSKLAQSGDVNQAEILRAQRATNEAEAKMINRQNQFLEQASIDLTQVEDEIAQNEQVLTQRQPQLTDSTFTAQMAGIVKNIRITTVGGVLKVGEELMQIVPVDDELLIEAKIRPSDIARIQPGLESTIRFDPFDYTIFGSVKGTVRYVSADTLKEESRSGEEIYYRVHVVSQSTPVTTTSGKVLNILPGMTAQVDIRTGDRTVMDYLLKPLRKTLSESLGER